MIELYIDGKKADLTTEISVPMTYELEKLQNPTIIKNNFSKTISLQATPTNNEIFGYYYRLDKIATGAGFDANKRIPFQLFRDCNLVETGYLQLNNIKHNNNNYVYEITLYGGLGDFFYSLAYDEEGNDKSLADLYYGFGENDEEMTFRMNADTVTQAWYNTNMPTERGTMGGVISFIPSYNGVYNDFDNNKVLINTHGTNIFATSATTDGTEYNTLNGYAYAELNEEYTEWQIRDLRCYKQRPALRMKAFIDAICKPENNGGYEVELDKEFFFNKDNPYYNDTWIALPLLNSDGEEFPKYSIDLGGQDVNEPIEVSLVSQPVEPSITPIFFDSYAVDEMENAGGTATVDMEVKFSLKTTTDYYNGINAVILSTITGEGKKQKPLWTGIGVWVEVIKGAETIAISDCLVFTKYMYKNGAVQVPAITDFKANFKNSPITNFTMVDGAFIRDDNDYETFVFRQTETGNNTFVLNLKNVPNADGVSYRIRTKRWFSENPTGMSEWVTPYMWKSNGGYVIMNDASVFAVDATSTLNTNSSKSLQGAIITKKQMLKNKITPASILTSFTKLFGLYFYKDCTQKKISIMTRNKFFKDAELIDIDNKIDWNKEVRIEPLMFDKKWYLLTTPALETTKMKNYKGDYYEAEYGQKRINTNYNFNTDIEDIYKDNQYQNIITMLDSSKYYRHFPSKAAGNIEFAPAFCNDGIKYHLFADGDYRVMNDVEYSKYDLINKNLPPIQWTNLVGADVMPKLCCFDMDNDKQSLNDLNVSLVFYNGMKYLEDSNGNPINYTVSNDIALMSMINEGTPMYLYSNSDTDINGSKICVLSNSLPQFSRYFTFAGNVVDSLDFGLPFESYINENYTEDTTLYNRFWLNFYKDQFNTDTRKVVAYVKFDELQLNNKALTNFYYFENSYWLLNKIIDYDIAYPYKQVKCEFIKVNNMGSYTDGQHVYNAMYEIYIDGENYWLDDMSENYVPYGGSWSAKVMTDYGVYKILITEDGVDITDRCWNSATSIINIENITGDIDVDIWGNSQPIQINYTNGTGTQLMAVSRFNVLFNAVEYGDWIKTGLSTPLYTNASAVYNQTEYKPENILFRITFDIGNFVYMGQYTITLNDGRTYSNTFTITKALNGITQYVIDVIHENVVQVDVVLMSVSNVTPISEGEEEV